jgi:hypothetical protein
MTKPNTLDLERTTRDHLQAAFAAYHEKHGRRIETRITTTFRGSAAQAKAVADGASQKPWGTSYHNFHPCYAADFVLVDTTAGDVLEGKTHAEWLEYEKVGIELEALGFTWGGRWHDPCDPGHAQAPISLADAREGKTPAWPDGGAA